MGYNKKDRHPWVMNQRLQTMSEGNMAIVTTKSMRVAKWKIRE